jgi:hypothetical protein
MIHSTSAWHRAGLLPALTVCETCCPFELFLIVAVPEVEDEALTVMVTESPALKEMPEKLIQAEGNHSYQAGVDLSSCATQVEGGTLPLTTVGNLPVMDGPVNTTLQNGLLTGIAVNADPGSAGVRRAGAAAGRHGRVRHGKGSSHTSDRSLC